MQINSQLMKEVSEMVEQRKIFVCPFCNSQNITKNTKKRNYRCENCQRSFPTNQVAVKKMKNAEKA